MAKSLVLVAALALLAVAGTVQAHIDLSVDRNLDGDCNDAGEYVINIPVPHELVERSVCVAKP